MPLVEQITVCNCTVIKKLLIRWSIQKIASCVAPWHASLMRVKTEASGLYSLGVVLSLIKCFITFESVNPCGHNCNTYIKHIYMTCPCMSK